MRIKTTIAVINMLSTSVRFYGLTKRKAEMKLRAAKEIDHTATLDFNTKVEVEVENIKEVQENE